jgi:hypothetical protein
MTLDSIIRNRVQNARPTFITTNLDNAGIMGLYGISAFSLLSERSKFFPVTGRDFRPDINERAIAEVERGETRPIS